MINIKQITNTPMGDALSELNQKMIENNMPCIRLNVIGGFALMLHGLRPIGDQTDIDYVGSDIPEEITKIARPIGIKHHLGGDWINNDVMLSGISIEDFEFATGPLHFEDALSTDKISIAILSQEDLLRMKIISIDTANTAIQNGGDFTRLKDFPDIINLMKSQNMTLYDIQKTYEDYIIGEDTIDLIRTYKIEGYEGIDQFIQKKQQKKKIQVNSKDLNNILNTLFQEYKNQEEQTII